MLIFNWFNLNFPKGIFASEIKSMVVPNQKLYYQQTTPTYSNKLSTISLSNCFLSALDYRVNSAFRVSVRPRQSYAAINVKLLEQQRPNSKYTSSCSRGMRPNTVSTRYTENLISDDEYERIGTPSTACNEATGYEYYTLTKDAFRPSPVRKLNKISLDEVNAKGFASKFVNNIEEHKMRKNIIKSASATKTKSTSIDSKSLSSIREVDLKKNSKKLSDLPNSTVVKSDLDENDHLIDHSELGTLDHASTKLDSAHLFKMTSDIFNEIYSEINKNDNMGFSNNNTNQNQNQIKTKIHSKSASAMKSPNSLVINDPNALTSSLSNRSKTVQFKTKSVSDAELNIQDEQPEAKASSREYLNNLKEEEFLEFLKEYRKSKCLNNLVETNRKNHSSVSNATSHPQLANIRTQFLNLYVDKNSISSCTSSTSNMQTNNLHDSLFNQQTNNYFYNYLKNKIILKQQSKSTTNTAATVNYLINDTIKKEDSLMKNNNLYFDANNLLENSTSRNKSKEREFKSQLNVLNFPSIENY